MQRKLKQPLNEVKDALDEIDTQLRFFPKAKDGPEKTEMYLKGIEINAQRIADVVRKARGQV